MATDAEDAGLVKELLWDGETVEETARQRGVGPGGSLITPTSVVCTNKRLFIVNRATLGLRKDYEVIQYRQITSVRLEHGLVSSSVFIRVQGYDRDKGLLSNGKEEGEINGLRNNEAKALADYLNRKIASANGVQEPDPQQDKTVGADKAGHHIYCSQCGNKCNTDAKYCEKCGAKL